MIVFFRVRPIAVTVLEVDSEIFDRFAGKFVEHARVDRVESWMVGNAEGGAECR